MEVVDERKDSFVKSLKDLPVVKKLGKIKNLQLIVAVFIIAIALVIYSNVADKNQSETTPVSSVMTAEEERLSAVLESIDGAGRVEVMVSRKGEDVVGILVIAEGADDISVLLKLQRATVSAMGVDKSVVEICKMK